MRCSIYNTVILVISLFLIWSCAKTDNKYEVIERTQKDVPNFQAAGTHTEVDYVLLHDGHKFYTACDMTTVDNLDPSARCGLLVLRRYDCAVQPASIEKAKMPLSDLKCKDGDGYNVYLYVSKKE